MSIHDSMGLLVVMFMLAIVGSIFIRFLSVIVSIVVGGLVIAAMFNIDVVLNYIAHALSIR